ncbi:hypothetical protein ABW19_dt0208771 [Dactylella cylindrospora]|nr:hypothetical protein ABW19_dt0208771 [Dactylella cylindrospora]
MTSRGPISSSGRGLFARAFIAKALFVIGFALAIGVSAQDTSEEIYCDSLRKERDNPDSLWNGWKLGCYTTRWDGEEMGANVYRLHEFLTQTWKPEWSQQIFKLNSNLTHECQQAFCLGEFTVLKVCDQRTDKSESLTIQGQYFYDLVGHLKRMAFPTAPSASQFTSNDQFNQVISSWPNDRSLDPQITCCDKYYLGDDAVPHKSDRITALVYNRSDTSVKFAIDPTRELIWEPIGSEDLPPARPEYELCDPSKDLKPT